MQTIDFDRIPLKAGDLILDLGCGHARHAIGALYAHPTVQVVYCDLDFNDLKTGRDKLDDFFSSNEPCHALKNKATSAVAEERVSLQAGSHLRSVAVQADGLCLPFDNALFDHIICSEVLEHVPAYEAMLREIRRVAKPEGTVSVSVPRYWPERLCWWLSREYHQVPGGHVRIFRKDPLFSQLARHDLMPIQRHYAHALHVPFWWLKCLFWSWGDDFFMVRWYHKLLVWDLLKKPALTRWLEKCLNPIMGKRPGGLLPRWT